MTGPSDQPQQDVAEAQLRDFARARFYNYILRQLVPAYIELRNAQRGGSAEDARNLLATVLRGRIVDASAYAALGQVPDPGAVTAKLLERVLEQSSQGQSIVGYLPEHKESVEALLDELNKGAIAFIAESELQDLPRYREVLAEDLRTLEYFGNLMD